jgi:hypothetical protein
MPRFSRLVILPVLLLAHSVFFGVTPSDDAPFVTITLDVEHPDRSAPYPKHSQIDEIVRFIATIKGINHHVQEIHFDSATKVEVTTGRRPYWDGVLPGALPDRGDKLQIQKTDGKWRVLAKSKWTFDGHMTSIEK